MPTDFDRKLAAFVRKQRGDLSYEKFGKKIGFPSSTIYRLEAGEFSMTIGKLHKLMKKLKVDFDEIFGKVDWKKPD